MPVINIGMHRIGNEEKDKLIRGVTAAAVEATAVPAECFVVLINELDDENIGVGGIPRDELVRNRK